MAQKHIEGDMILTLFTYIYLFQSGVLLMSLRDRAICFLSILAPQVLIIKFKFVAV